jgi:hypothetical protein
MLAATNFNVVLGNGVKNSRNFKVLMPARRLRTHKAEIPCDRHGFDQVRLVACKIAAAVP